MMFPKIHVLLFSMMAVCASAICCCADPSSSTNRPGYLISQHRFPEAADYLAEATEPNSVQTLASRAALLLYAGRAHQAGAVFVQLRNILPQGEALPEYALGLCALMEHDYPAAKIYLDQAHASPGYAAHSEEIDLAQALLKAADGNLAGAITLASGNKSAAASEIIALLQLKKAPSDPDTLKSTEELVESWDLPGGVPHVVEEPGLRIAGPSEETRIIGIEPAIESEVDRLSVVSRLLQSYSQPDAAPSQRVSGLFTITPTMAGSIRSGSFVSYYVDHNLAASTNGGSYSYRWDTTTVTNGLHTVTIVISDGSSSSIENENHLFNVENAAANASAIKDSSIELSDQDRATITDTWGLLALQPSYKMIEMALSRGENRAGNRDAALRDLTIAAALDFPYAGGRSAIAGSYTGRIPTYFKATLSSRYVSAKSGLSGNTTMGIWRGNPNIKEIALTFDDGPSPTDTPPLLDTLRDNNVPGTFFVVGIRAEAAPDILRRMHNEGHEVEDHTFTHPNLDQAITEHIYEEILRDGVIVRSLTGIWPHFLRPPGGETNPQVLESAEDCGMAGAFWTIDVLSAEDIGSPSGVVTFVMSRAKPGAIVLMHNGTYATTQAIPELARQLRSRGYKLVTLLQLARDASAR